LMPLQGVLPLRLKERFHALFLLRTFGKNLSVESFLTWYLRVSKNEEIGLSQKDCRPSWGSVPRQPSQL
jgi:hypothetical protein